MRCLSSGGKVLLVAGLLLWNVASGLPSAKVSGKPSIVRPELPVETVEGKGYTEQIIPDKFLDRSENFNNLGELTPDLDYRGREECRNTFPFPLPNIKYSSSNTKTTNNMGELPPAPRYTEPFVLHLEKLSRREFVDDEYEELYKRQQNTNIFVPIETTSPPQIFSRRNDHPVPRKSIIDGNQRAYQTNKFYANLFLDNQDGPVFTLPYSIWWSKGLFNSATGKTDPFGISISHVDRSQRAYGPTNSTSSAGNGAVEFYLNPIYIRSMNMGAKEFNPAVSTMELTKLDQMSVTVLLHANKTANVNAQVKKMITVPLCQGMGFVSGDYDGLTPVIESSIGFQSITAVDYRPEATKYRVKLLDGKRWIIYAWSRYPGTNSTYASFQIVNQNRIEAQNPFSGLIQIAKIGGNDDVQPEANDAAMESLLDSTSGTMCTGVSISGSVSGSTGTYKFDYSTLSYKSSILNANLTRGLASINLTTSSDLLTWCLPHHQSSFTSSTASKITPNLQLTSLTKGWMKPVVSNTWTLQEPSLPTNINFLPVIPSDSTVKGPATFPPSALTTLSNIARQEISQDFLSQTNLSSIYFSGKALSKFANLCLAANTILRDQKLTATCLSKLKTSLNVFINNKQTYKLVYEYGWRGIVTNAIYQVTPLDPNIDFGNGYYNDHHFHFGYFVHTAAIIVYIDKQLGNPPTYLNTIKPYINALVRDVSNPSSQDPYFPVFRTFDFFHGHSWAKGLFPSLDGKDQESSSEEINFFYALKLWGQVSSQPLLEQRGNLFLGILKRSINTYFLISSTNTIHPQNFLQNKVTGILFENKVHHTTYFGNVPQYVQGIHMLPLTPMLAGYIRQIKFVQEEWAVYFTNGRTSNINDGWKGILYGNIVAWLPKNAWTFFAQSGFKAGWLDGGASRTWYLVMAGGLGGAA